MSFNCEECGLLFSRSYNLTRHKEMFHVGGLVDSVQDSEDCPKRDIFGYPMGMSADDITDKEDSAQDSDSDSDNKDDEDGKDSDQEEEIDETAFNCMITRTYRVHRQEAIELAEEMMSPNDEFENVRDAVYSTLLPKYQKTLKSIYTAEILKMESLRQHHIHKNVMKTVRKLMRKGMDLDEAIRQAVSTRKHLIYRLLNDYQNNDDDDDNDADDEEQEEDDSN